MVMRRFDGGKYGKMAERIVTKAAGKNISRHFSQININYFYYECQTMGREECLLSNSANGSFSSISSHSEQSSGN